MSEKLDRKQQAVERHEKGYNCAQAVVCTYADLLDVEESTSYRMAEGMGFGCGGLQEICGALSGAFMVVGLENSSGDVQKGITKKDTYGKVKAMGEEFKAKNTSVRCSELMGTNGHKLRSCQGCIEDACELVEHYLEEQKIVK